MIHTIYLAQNIRAPFLNCYLYCSEHLAIIDYLTRNVGTFILWISISFLASLLVYFLFITFKRTCIVPIFAILGVLFGFLFDIDLILIKTLNILFGGIDTEDKNIAIYLYLLTISIIFLFTLMLGVMISSEKKKEVIEWANKRKNDDILIIALLLFFISFTFSSMVILQEPTVHKEMIKLIYPPIMTAGIASLAYLLKLSWEENDEHEKIFISNVENTTNNEFNITINVDKKEAN